LASFIISNLRIRNLWKKKSATRRRTKIRTGKSRCWVRIPVEDPALTDGTRSGQGRRKPRPPARPREKRRESAHLAAGDFWEKLRYS
jgi:hypothetical protein